MAHQYTSERAFAKAVGVSQSALRKTLRLEDCPVGVKGPWSAKDLDLLNRYRATQQEDRSAGHRESLATPISDLGPVRLVDLKLKTERMLLVKRQREVLEGRHIPISQHLELVRNLAAMAAGRLAGLPASVAPMLVGLDAAEIQGELEKQVEAIRRHLSDPSNYETDAA